MTLLVFLVLVNITLTYSFYSEKIVATAYISRYKRLRENFEEVYANIMKAILSKDAATEEIVKTFIEKQLEIYDLKIREASKFLEKGDYSRSIDLAKDAIKGLKSLFMYLNKTSFSVMRESTSKTSPDSFFITHYTRLLMRKASILTFLSVKLGINNNVKLINEALSLLGEINSPSLSTPNVREKLRASTLMLEEAEKRVLSTYPQAKLQAGASSESLINGYLEELAKLNDELSGMRILVFIDDIFFNKHIEIININLDEIEVSASFSYPGKG
ncbi:MAG TPA: hypothetical protein ENF80_02900 [Thermofilum sp.]|nr:hypothetical protein [Thermofilum sp.]